MLEQPPRIRPGWLFAGGAILGVLALCALVAVFAVGVLFVTSRQQQTSTPVPTAAVVQSRTEQPTRTSAAASVTPLPGVNTTPAPSTGQSTPNPGNLPPPDEAVGTYYQLVGDGRYDQTWPMLTDAFKQKFNCCAPNYNYSGYINWWNSVDRVELGEVLTVSQSGDRAVVYAEIYFVMNTGTRTGMDSDPYIHLIYDSSAGMWRFEDKQSRAA